MKYDSEAGFQTQDIENSEWLALGSDETIEAWGHPSMYPFLPGLVFGVILTLVGLILPLFYGWMAFVIFPLGLALVGVEYIKYMSVVYVFTNRRIFRKHGIISNHTNDTEYKDIQTVQTKRSIIERLLNFGDIRISTAGADGDDVTLINIPDVQKAYTKINERALE